MGRLEWEGVEAEHGTVVQLSENDVMMHLFAGANIVARYENQQFLEHPNGNGSTAGLLYPPFPTLLTPKITLSL